MEAFSMRVQEWLVGVIKLIHHHLFFHFLTMIIKWFTCFMLIFSSLPASLWRYVFIWWRSNSPHDSHKLIHNFAHSATSRKMKCLFCSLVDFSRFTHWSNFHMSHTTEKCSRCVCCLSVPLSLQSRRRERGENWFSLCDVAELTESFMCTVQWESHLSNLI